ncbi:YpjP family protein [Alkalihalobacillus sp. FSL R5-0424]
MLGWMKHFFLVASALMTFGLSDYEQTSHTLPLFSSEKSDTGPQAAKSFVYKINEHDYSLFHSVFPSDVHDYIHRDEEHAKQLAKQFTEQAKQQSYLKFGSTIEGRISPLFEGTVLTSFEEALSQRMASLSVEEQEHLQVTNHPSSGRGEKIVHVFSLKTGEDLIRFHVRRDQPPKQGHWFNFHYHVASDNYEHHYPLASIYWGKDVPPLWKA